MKKTLKKHGGPRKNSGRPQSDNPKSKNLAFVRVTADHREKIKTDAKKAGFASDADYVRSRLGLS